MVVRRTGKDGKTADGSPEISDKNGTKSSEEKEFP